MEQERNPNKNAELAMEQNGNMIDGIINNLPAPPPEEKPLDRVSSLPLRLCPRTGGADPGGYS